MTKTDKSCSRHWAKAPNGPEIEWESCDGAEACLRSLDDAHALAEYLEAVAIWIRQAEATCKESAP